MNKSIFTIAAALVLGVTSQDSAKLIPSDEVGLPSDFQTIPYTLDEDNGFTEAGPGEEVDSFDDCQSKCKGRQNYEGRPSAGGKYFSGPEGPISESSPTPYCTCFLEMPNTCERLPPYDAPSPPNVSSPDTPEFTTYFVAITVAQRMSECPTAASTPAPAPAPAQLTGPDSLQLPQPPRLCLQCGEASASAPAATVTARSLRPAAARAAADHHTRSLIGIIDARQFNFRESSRVLRPQRRRALLFGPPITVCDLRKSGVMTTKQILAQVSCPNGWTPAADQSQTPPLAYVRQYICDPIDPNTKPSACNLLCNGCAI